MLDLAPYDPVTATHPSPHTATASRRAVGVRLVVADDHPLYREGVVHALQSYGGFEVVGQAGDGADALNLIRTLVPDLALLDVRMPLLDGVDVVHALALHGPDVPVVMLSAFSEQPLVDSALSAGAAGYINKGEDRELMCRRLAAIAEHCATLAPRRLSPHDPITPSRAWLPRLTGAEYELLQLAGHDVDKVELCAALSLAEQDLRVRIAAITRKFDCDSLGDAVGRARILGLIR